MLSSDRHHDNTHSRRDLELAHLQQAKERNAIILDIGDLFCAMQGKFDPRRSQDDLRPEDKGDNYLDLIVKHAAEFYSPYANLFSLMTPGNHESAILKSNGTDLVNSLVHRLNSDHGGRVYKGGYGGWVRFEFIICKTQREAKSLKYFHGKGGGGPVTRGVIDTARQAVYLPDADIVVNGHTHDQYHLPIARERLTKNARVSRDVVHFIRTGTYKDEYGDGSGGWATEKGLPPKPLGCVWLRFFARHFDNHLLVDTEITLSTS